MADALGLRAGALRGHPFCATLDGRREAVTTLEDVGTDARRVLPAAHLWDEEWRDLQLVPGLAQAAAHIP